ncbi:hypothetical protein RvY_04636 [Ramazzottius varieornatus]|uniref:Uncharacterized protein n=1 Tax=Ramazzottius varieornatus TaxID=947166 RepID=A0A1D1V1G7_RAMVA|nr:hypothetical protein RvY_04636 [Ramazzottius varieornatus]
MGLISVTFCLLGAFYSLFISHLHLLRATHRIYFGRWLSAMGERNSLSSFQSSVVAEGATGEIILGTLGIILTVLFIVAIVRLLIGLEQFSKSDMTFYVIVGAVFAFWQFVTSVIDLSRSTNDYADAPNYLVLSNPGMFRNQIEIGAGTIGLVALPVNIAVVVLVFIYNRYNGR